MLRLYVYDGPFGVPIADENNVRPGLEYKDPVRTYKCVGGA